MNALIIDPTSHLPRVEFNKTGDLLIEGRSIPENANQFYNPLIEFIRNLKVQRVIFNVNLEYFNTASSKKLLLLFKALDKNEEIVSIHVNWHFETGDEDSTETAAIYEDSLERATFTYHEHPEVEFALAG